MRLAHNLKLRLLPAQLIMTEIGAILKRGRTEIEFGTKAATQAIQMIMNATGKQGMIVQDICMLFPAKSVRHIKKLLAQLGDWRIMVPDNSDSNKLAESNLDIFYWEVQKEETSAIEELNKRHIVILGVNFITRQLAVGFRSSGMERFTVIDYPDLRNQRLFERSGKLRRDLWLDLLPVPVQWNGDLEAKSVDCLVVTSDFGSTTVFREWNRFCIKGKLHYLPVMLMDLVGYIGPIVVPGETACFECLQARQNSHIEHPKRRRALEAAAFEGQHIVGFHPSMASILGDIVVLELTKLYGQLVPPPKIGTLIEVDLLETRLTGRKVLKVPRCQACSPMTSRASTAPDKTTFGQPDPA